MNRRDMLLTTGAAALGLSAFPFGWAAAADKKKQKVLYFSRSAGFVHPMVIRKEDGLSVSDKVLIGLGEKNGFEVVCAQDGAVFDGDLDQYDCFAFYTSGNLTAKSREAAARRAHVAAGKEKLMAAIAAGKGFVGIHSATDSFRTKGIDPYIAMIGGEFLGHDAQQKAKMKVVDPKFPGMAGLGRRLRDDGGMVRLHQVQPRHARDHGARDRRHEGPELPAPVRIRPRGPGCKAKAACSTRRWAIARTSITGPDVRPGVARRLVLDHAERRGRRDAEHRPGDARRESVEETD